MLERCSGPCADDGSGRVLLTDNKEGVLGLRVTRALDATSMDVGNALTLCAFTTAIGFFAFIPTAYRGVAELGLISGTGMFISLFLSLSLLPALLAFALPVGSGNLGPNGLASAQSLCQAEIDAPIHIVTQCFSNREFRSSEDIDRRPN